MYNFLRIFNLFILSSLMTTLGFAMEIKDVSHAINIAGKQRMFTQKILKDYAMIGMENKFANPKDDLKKVTADFESHLDALDKFTNDEEIKKSIQETKTLWLPIKKSLAEKPKKEQAKKLQQSLESLLKVSDDTTKLFAKQAKERSGDIINIAGRQRMLSQKMASLYMLKVWGIDDVAFQKKMQSTMLLFKNSLEELITYKKNTAEISTLLTKVKRSFMFFEIMNKSTSKFIPSLIYKKSDDILQNMNKVTALYAEQK